MLCYTTPSMEGIKSIISFDEFSKVDLAVGKIVEVIDVPQSEKLYKMTVDFGPSTGASTELSRTSSGLKTIFAGLRKFILKRQLKNKKFVFVVNLAPRPMPSGESQGMMLVIEHKDGFILLPAPKGSVEGSRLT